MSEPVAPSQDQYERRRLETRAKLLDAGRRLFQDPGYAATTVADLAAAAKVGRATFYLHFGNKEEVYRAIAAEFIADVTPLFRALDEALASGSTEQFRRWLDVHASWASTNVAPYLVWNEAGSSEPEMSSAIWRVAISAWLDVMPRYVDQWSRAQLDEPLIRLGLFTGQLQFFHHSLLSVAERALALDVLAAAWHAQLRPPAPRRSVRAAARRTK